MNNIVSNQEFSDSLSAIESARNKWIGLIESRLKDLTGLRLSKEHKYKYLFDDNPDEIPIKRSGKETVVIFPTNHIEQYLRTDNLFDVWSYILGRIDTGSVFQNAHVCEKKKMSYDAETQLENIRGEILRYNDGDFGISDVLGVFAYPEHMIKLYVQVIAWHSITDGIGTEELAFVVLAHELSHAYTMSGYDINGYRGELMENYCSRGKRVTEGLAQYYTEAVCCQLKPKYPQFKQAFEALLAKQTDPYTWHKTWLTDRPDHEIVRALTLEYRKKLIQELSKVG